MALLRPVSAAEKTTFDDHVLPVFQQACLNCHNPDKAKGGLDLSTFAATLKGGSGGKIAEPGDPASKLLAVVAQTAEPKMPPEGDKLAAEKINVLKAWIDGGLLENKSSSARKPSKPKVSVALRSDPAAKPDGPPPMPLHLLLDPPVVTPRAAPVLALAASPWAPLVATTSQRQILLHHSDSLELVGILPFPEGDPVSLAFTPDARHLIVGGGVPGKSGLTVTFDIVSGRRVLTAGKEFDSVLAADLAPDFSTVATGSPSRLLKLWDTTTNEARKSIKKHTDWITALDISPDGILCASGDRNGGIWVWETGSGNEFHTLRAHQAAITTLAFRTDSNILASASQDGTVRFWEMNGGTEVRKNDAHAGGVTALAFARDGSSLTVGRDMKAKWWKPDFNHARDLAQNLPSLPVAATTDADGKRAFVGGYDGIVRVFDTATGQAAGEFTTAPPAIETRLRTLAEQIRTHPQVIAGAEAAAADAARKLAEAKDRAAKAQDDSTAKRIAHEATKKAEADTKTAIAAADAALQAKRAELEPAKTDPAKLAAIEASIADLTKKRADLDPALAATAKAVADTLASFTEAEKVTKAAVDAVPPAEKSLVDAQAAIPPAKEQLARLQSTERHWQAAAINTEAIRASAAAEELSSRHEDLVATFTAAAKAVDQQAAAAAAAAERRIPFARQLAGIDPATQTHLAAELSSVLDTIDHLAHREREKLASLTRDLAAARKEIDSLAPSRVSADTKAADLAARYLAALPKPQQ